MATSLPPGVLKSMVRIEEHESTMLDLSTACLNQRNVEYVVAFLRAMAVTAQATTTSETTTRTTATRTTSRTRCPPLVRGITIRCRFSNLQALTVLCDYLVSNECQIRVLILSITNLCHSQLVLLCSALCNNTSVDELAIYANHQYSQHYQQQHQHQEQMTSLQASIFKSLLQHNKTFQKLTLVQLDFLSPACYQEIAKGLACHACLRSLSLDSCTINAEATEALMQALVASSTTTTSSITTTSCTTLDHLHLGHVHLSKRALQAVTTMACRGETLREVSIVSPCHDASSSNNNNNDNNILDPADFASLLGPTSSIEKLTLDACGIHDQAAKPIFGALEHNQRLRDFHLPRNPLTRQGYLVMLASMPRWLHLQRLGVDGGAALLSCRESLVQGLRGNRSLHYMGLDANLDLGPHNPQIRSHTRRFLRRNRRLDQVRHLLMSVQQEQHADEENIPLGLWPRVLKCVSATRRDSTELSEAFQLVSLYAVEWAVTRNGRGV